MIITVEVYQYTGQSQVHIVHVVVTNEISGIWCIHFRDNNVQDYVSKVTSAYDIS